MRETIYSKYIKRLFDIIASLLGLIVLSPVLLVISILVRAKLGSPAIYKQKRPGKNEKIFTLYKFRTMTDEKDENGELAGDEIRLTPFGKKLRSTSLDELPELVNILKGDMSVVGPRPLLVRYLPLYNDRQKHRHDARPGLSGLAQVSGRNAITWESRFEYDVEYTERITARLDLAIIYRTVKTVFTHEGITSEESVTMEEFLGTQEKQ